MHTIYEVVIRKVELPLTRPYAIAYQSLASVSNIFVELISTQRYSGLGVASPAEDVTGESLDSSYRELTQKAASLLKGQSYRCLFALQNLIAREFSTHPAAMAALDMALWDLFAKAHDLPLVSLWGRACKDLPTSITVGIKPLDEALAEIKEYRERGFRSVKLKIGKNLESDLELIKKSQEAFGRDLRFRADLNQGYTPQEFARFIEAIQGIPLEMLEQPLAPGDEERLPQLAKPRTIPYAADESLVSLSDAIRLLTQHRSAYEIFNIKLMKCGGPSQAQHLARLAAWGGKSLMWGCMDESCISISAALNTAYSCGASAYLDLDGSLDLARDLARGGFTIEAGIMRPVNKPGLGVVWND